MGDYIQSQADLGRRYLISTKEFVNTNLDWACKQDVQELGSG